MILSGSCGRVVCPGGKMAMGFWPARLWRGVFAAFVGACLTLCSSGCALSEYACISLKSGAAPADVQALALLARAGNKDAQLSLGILLEAGHRIPVDLTAARQMYAAAAADTGGRLSIWSPPVGRSPGHIIVVDSGQRTSGLAQAEMHLRALDARMALERSQ